MTGVGITERIRDGIVRWRLNKIIRAKDPTYPTYATSKGDKWDDLPTQSNGVASDEYEREERLAIQNEPPPERLPDIPDFLLRAKSQ